LWLFCCGFIAACISYIKIYLASAPLSGLLSGSAFRPPLSGLLSGLLFGPLWAKTKQQNLQSKKQKTRTQWGDQRRAKMYQSPRGSHLPADECIVEECGICGDEGLSLNEILFTIITTGCPSCWMARVSTSDEEHKQPDHGHQHPDLQNTALFRRI